MAGWFALLFNSSARGLLLTIGGGYFEGSASGGSVSRRWALNIADKLDIIIKDTKKQGKREFFL